MSLYKTVLFILALSLGLAACAPASSSTAQPSLDGTHWQLFSTNGQTISGDQLPTINFEDGEVGGSGGCNTYGGSYQADPASGSLNISELFSTVMACVDDEANRLESDFFAALQAVDSYEIDSENALHLYAADADLVFYTQP